MQAKSAWALTVLLLLAGAVQAGYGPQENGWPVAADGTSTAPDANRVAGATVFPYWPALTVEVQRLADTYPELVRLHSAGTSSLGLDLWMLEIADFAQIDDGTGLPLEARETVWVDGGTHSNEYSGVDFTLAVAQFLVESYGQDDNATWIVDNRHTWIMPMVNPDGANAFGRLNAHAVNINRNYPVVWDGEGNDILLNNRGPSPASEVETQIVIEWFNQTQPDYMASIHCCGNLWLYPYGEEGVDPPDNGMLQRVCDEAFPEVRKDCGPIWSTIYPASGSSVDTAYEYTGAVSFGYEMSGRGAILLWGQPWTFEDVFEQESESWQGLLHAFLNVHRYGTHLELVSAAPTAKGMEIRLVNNGLADLTGGNVSYDGTTYPLPPLAAGSATDLTIEGALDADPRDLQITYPKRIMATPMAESLYTASVVDDALVLDGAETSMVVGKDGLSGYEATIPAFPPILAGALLLVAVAVARRRR